MKPVPPELLQIIARGGHRRTMEDQEQMPALALAEVDAVNIAQTGVLRKKTRDPRWEGRYVWTVLGNDTQGRSCSMAGKVIRRHGRRVWKIITLHGATR